MLRTWWVRLSRSTCPWKISAHFEARLSQLVTWKFVYRSLLSILPSILGHECLPEELALHVFVRTDWTWSARTGVAWWSSSDKPDVRPVRHNVRCSRTPRANATCHTIAVLGLECRHWTLYELTPDYADVHAALLF